MAESMQRLFSLLILVLLTIFVMLALPFRSYIQPLIVMTAIPFGLVGAVFGHLIMGYDLSVISLMGILALSGVVVNDAIVLIDHANERRREGLSPFLAVTQAGIRRFRPIMLTTLTTFGGLAPMIFETSRQARFMIPMALSLGYGILFATSITLVLVPSLYLIAEDVKGLAPSTRRARRVARPAVSAASSVLLALTLVLAPPARAGERVDGHANPENPAVEQQTISPNSFQGSDVERINQAIRAASPQGLRVVIPRQNKARDGTRDVWLLDSAILVQDDTTLELDGCRIKLSDRCRDNMIRSANCGLGITDIRTVRHVSIVGRGNVLLEGADRPRATGDSAKTLGSRTFGTDAGVDGESQTGDWRNIGILLACVEHFRIENLQIRDSHCWAISLERCAFGRVRDIHFESAGSKVIDGTRKTILNQDGLDLRQGCHDISIERITGATGDDLVALTDIRNARAVAGSDTSTMVSAANCREGGVDDIRNIFLRQITGHSRGGHHVVRFLNAGGLRLYNVVLDGLIDTSPPGRPCKATLKIGDANPAWGGVTPLGDTHSLLLSNITGRSRHTILIAGSLTDSCISNVIRQADGGEPITYESGRKFVRNLQCTNVMRAGAPGDR
jgi:hypothetical protein